MVNPSQLQRVSKAFRVAQLLAMALLCVLKVFQAPAVASGR